LPSGKCFNILVKSVRSRASSSQYDEARAVAHLGMLRSRERLNFIDNFPKRRYWSKKDVFQKSKRHSIICSIACYYLPHQRNFLHVTTWQAFDSARPESTKKGMGM